MALRLNALSQALNFLSRIGVDYVIFEDLFLVRGGSSLGARAVIERFRVLLGSSC
jgi:hypothetical protein